MNTITVTCPEDGERLAVVEPEDWSRDESLTVTCPSCSQQFSIIYPDDVEESVPTQPTHEPLEGELEEWELREEPPDPYTGRDEDIPPEQYVVADIAGLTWYGTDRFQIWYTPEHEASKWKEIAYVVRAGFVSGVKTKNIYRAGSTLFVKNRGVPHNSDKRWTYLEYSECQARATFAGLDSNAVTEDPTQEGRYHIFLNQKPQPLVDEDGELAEELVLELARVLVAFQTDHFIGG